MQNQDSSQSGSTIVQPLYATQYMPASHGGRDLSAQWLEPGQQVTHVRAGTVAPDPETGADFDYRIFFEVGGYLYKAWAADYREAVGEPPAPVRA